MARTRTRPRRQETIEQVLEGAQLVFSERGFHGAGIAEICARAGLTRGAFYSSFGSKEALFLALYDRMTARMLDGLDGLVEGISSRRATVDDTVERFAENTALDRDWYLLNSEFTLYAIRNPDAAAALSRRRARLRDGIAAAVAAILSEAGRSLSVDGDLVARVLIGLADSNLSQHLIDPSVGRTSLVRAVLRPLLEALSRPVRET